MMTKYRLEALDENDRPIHSVPMDIGTLDGVIVVQLDRDLCVTQKELERLDERLAEAFPGRRRLILMGGIRFMRFVPVEEGQ